MSPGALLLSYSLNAERPRWTFSSGLIIHLCLEPQRSEAWLSHDQTVQTSMKNKGDLDEYQQHSILGPLPQVEHTRLDDESEQVLQGFQSSKEQFRLARVLGISHIKVQYLGEFPKKGRKAMSCATYRVYRLGYTTETETVVSWEAQGQAFKYSLLNML